MLGAALEQDLYVLNDRRLRPGTADYPGIGEPKPSVCLSRFDGKSAEISESRGGAEGRIPRPLAPVECRCSSTGRLGTVICEEFVLARPWVAFWLSLHQLAFGARLTSSCRLSRGVDHFDDSVGLEDQYEEHRTRAVLEHLEDYRRHLTTKRSNTEAHVRKTCSRIRGVIDACGFAFFRS